MFVCFVNIHAADASCARSTPFPLQRIVEIRRRINNDNNNNIKLLSTGITTAYTHSCPVLPPPSWMDLPGVK